MTDAASHIVLPPLLSFATTSSDSLGGRLRFG